MTQLGTLGSGNHFIEVQVVDKVFKSDSALVLNIEENDVVIMIHTGSRGLGYQVCDDYANGMIPRMQKFGITVPDKQLACAPIESSYGTSYIGAMSSAANYGWANRQIIMHWVRQALIKVIEKQLNMKNSGLSTMLLTILQSSKII